MVPTITMSSPTLRVRRLAKSMDGSGQSVGISSDGRAYTWGRTNKLGQLGRRSGEKPSKKPHPAQFVDPDDPSRTVDNVKVVRAFAGGNEEAGHTAVLDSTGSLWLAGTDRWQQLGLCNAALGTIGYTWDGLWKEAFHRNTFVPKLLSDVCCDATIRDIAIGGDHTLVLSANKRDVIAFGKGGDGQLGLAGFKPWVSAPVRSKELSSRKGDIAAVCAINHCSLTLGNDGQVLSEAGKCSKRMSKRYAAALQYCQKRAERDGLVLDGGEKYQ
mmetsp:Transcript_21993/g.45446  ORF Transcript_21993/g.45446 Transcript_21993/m.45446 type:complete len:271 (-) Transcript_21993:1784-2596(-)